MRAIFARRSTPRAYGKFLVYCLLALLASASDQAPAQSTDNFWRDFQRARELGRVTTTIDLDNDTLLFKRDDKFYTSGLRLTRQFSLPATDSGRTSYGWRIGQDLYTASDIKLPPRLVSPSDHPYAGWLYAGLFRKITDPEGSYRRVGLDLGCLGPCAGGRSTQTALHRIISQPRPQGWSGQVRGEAGAVLYADVAPVRWHYGRKIDLTPSVQGRFGNIFSDVAASLVVRGGQLDPLPDLAVLQTHLRVQARAVGYNATLQGGYFSNHNPHVVAPRRLVGEVEVAVRWTGKHYTLSAALVRIGNEIAELPSSIGAQNLARLRLEITR